MATVVKPHTFIMRRLKDALAEFMDQQHLDQAVLDIKQHGQDPSILFLWPHSGMTRGVLISFGQNEDLQLEIYAGVDYGSYRKWRTEFLERIPDVIDTKADWLPIMMIAIRAARTMVNSWKESSLNFTSPVLTGAGWIDIRMGSLPNLTPSRGSDTLYRLSPLWLASLLFLCYILAVWAAFAPDKDMRALLLFISSVAEVAVLWFHVMGKKLKRRR